MHDDDNPKLIDLIKQRWLTSLIITLVFFSILLILANFLRQPIQMDNVIVCFAVLYSYWVIKPKVLHSLKKILV